MAYMLPSEGWTALWQGGYCAPINVDVTPCHSPHASEGWFLVDQIAVDGAEYRVGLVAVKEWFHQLVLGISTG